MHLTAQAMLALTEITQWRMSELVARSVAEYTSIFGAAALLTFGSITPVTGQSVHVATVWAVAGVSVGAPFCLAARLRSAVPTLRSDHSASVAAVCIVAAVTACAHGLTAAVAPVALPLSTAQPLCNTETDRFGVGGHTRPQGYRPPRTS